MSTTGAGCTGGGVTTGCACVTGACCTGGGGGGGGGVTAGAVASPNARATVSCTDCSCSCVTIVAGFNSGLCSVTGAELLCCLGASTIDCAGMIGRLLSVLSDTVAVPSVPICTFKDRFRVKVCKLI